MTFVADQLNARKVDVIDDGEAYGQDLAAATAASLSELNVVVRRLSVERGAVDFSEDAKAVLVDAPDFVVFAGFNPETALFYRQLRDAGYQDGFGGTDAAAVKRTFIDPLGALAEGVYFSGCSPRLPEGFAKAFRDMHGSDPVASAFTPSVADATTILLDAVDQVAESQADGSLVISPEQLRDAVARASLPNGVSGQISFAASGDRTSSGKTLEERAVQSGWTGCQVKDDNFEILFPTP